MVFLPYNDNIFTWYMYLFFKDFGGLMEVRMYLNGKKKSEGEKEKERLGQRSQGTRKHFCLRDHESKLSRN